MPTTPEITTLLLVTIICVPTGAILGYFISHTIHTSAIITLKEKLNEVEVERNELKARVEDAEAKIKSLLKRREELENRLGPLMYTTICKPTSFTSNGDLVVNFYWLRSAGHYAEWKFTGIRIESPFSIHFAVFVHHKIDGWPCFGEIKVIVEYHGTTETFTIRLNSRDYQKWSVLNLGDYISITPKKSPITAITVRLVWTGYDVWPPCNPGPDGIPEHFGIHQTKWVDYCWILVYPKD